MIRVAAVADVHVGADSAGRLRPNWEHLPDQADVFVIAGDLTRRGLPEEATVLAGEVEDVAARMPTFAVLGNHDYHCDQQETVTKILDDGAAVGVAGVKGFGGGFAGACGSDFGEPEMKAFVAHTRQVAGALEAQLHELSATSDVRIALMHYSPVEATLRGERLEIYPFLGSYLLAEAVDRAGADLVVHGHAHGGSEKGVTPGGVHVRNVALPVINHAYNVYELS